MYPSFILYYFNLFVVVVVSYSSYSLNSVVAWLFASTQQQGVPGGADERSNIFLSNLPSHIFIYISFSFSTSYNMLM